MPALSDAVAQDEFPRAGPAENKSTMTAYQMLAQLPSATPHAARDPKARSSLPQGTPARTLVAPPYPPSCPVRMECCGDRLRPPLKRNASRRWRQVKAATSATR